MSDQSQTKWTGLRAKLAGLSLNSARRHRQEARLLELILQHVQDSTVALDIGAGTGFLALAVAERAREGKVYALDLSADMLAQLRRSAVDKGLRHRVETIVSEAGASGLPSASVDLVISANLLHEVPYPAAVVAEAARVIRTGGHLVIRDLLGGRLRGPVLKLLHHRSAHGPLSPKHLRHLLLDTGFDEVNIEIGRKAMIATGVRYRV